MEENRVFEATVIWFSAKKGFGFLQWSKDGVAQKDMFCHHSDLDMQGFRTLKAGQKVQFKLGVNHHGDPKATSVKIIA